MDDVRDVIIIGSGPAGLTAALYTARANLQPLLIEGLEAGGQLMLTTTVENFPGFTRRHHGARPDGARCARRPSGSAPRSSRAHVTSVDLSRRPFAVRDRRGASTGAKRSSSPPARRRGCSGCPSERHADGPRRVDLRHVRRLLLPGQADRRRRRRRLGARGGDLPHEVRVEGHADPPARRAARRRRSCRTRRAANPKIDVPLEQRSSRTSKDVDEGRGDAPSCCGTCVTGERSELPVDGVFVAIGHTPNTSLFAGQLELDANGYIVTHDGTHDERAGRVRVRRRAGPRLPAGDHRRRLGLHGRARRRALPGGLAGRRERAHGVTA